MVYGKDWGYNVFSCKYCLYWKGMKRGCIFRHGCCCPIPQNAPVRNGVRVRNVKINVTKSECDGCPYGKASPCIGWCTRKIVDKTRYKGI